MKRILFAAMLLGATPALADGCPEHSPIGYAVQFKMESILGEPISGLDELSLKELGDRHWRARKIAEWSDSLAPGNVQSCYREWAVFYLTNIEEEVYNRFHRQQPSPDTEGELQAKGHLLVPSLPTPK